MGQLEIPIVYPPDITSVIRNSKAFDQAYIMSSSLLRCRQTTKYVCELFPEKIIQVQYLDELKERSLGSFEGKEKATLYHDHFYYNDHNQLILERTPPGAEPIHDFLTRVGQAIPLIEQCLNSNNIVIISHLQVLRALTCKLRIKNISDWYDISFSHGNVVRIY